MAVVGDLTVRLRADVTQFTVAMADAENRMLGFGRTGRRVMGQMAGSFVRAGLTLGALVGAASLKAVTDFDTSIRAAGATSLATANDFELLKAKALELGRTTTFTAVEIAELMAVLGTAGFNPKEIDSVTESVMLLSKATRTDSTTAAGIMGSTLRQFDLQASEAGRVADVLTAAANNSFNTVEQLGETLSYIGTISSELEIPLEEAVGLVGVLGNLGIQSSSAGTAIRRLMAITSSEAEKLTEVFGRPFIDAQGNVLGMRDALEQMHQGVKDIEDPAARLAKFNEGFGLLGLTSASALSGNLGSIDELTETLVGADAADTAQETYDKMTEGFDGMWKRLSSAATGFLIKIGYAMEGSILSWGDAIANWINRVTDNYEWLVNKIAQYMLIASGIWTYVTENWEDILRKWGLVAVGIFVTWMMDVKHVLTVVLPAYWNWAMTNLTNIAGTHFDNILTAFKNVAHNMRQAWRQFYNFVHFNRDFHPEFKGLTEGFKEVMLRDMPEIADRGKTEIENILNARIKGAEDRLKTSYFRSVTEPLHALRMMQRVAQPGGPTDFDAKLPGAKPPGGGGLPVVTPPAVKATYGTSGGTGAAKGSAEAYKIILDAMRKSRTSPEVVELRRQTNILQRIEQFDRLHAEAQVVMGAV